MCNLRGLFRISCVGGVFCVTLSGREFKKRDRLHPSVPGSEIAFRYLYLSALQDGRTDDGRRVGLLNVDDIITHGGGGRLLVQEVSAECEAGEQVQDAGMPREPTRLD